MSCNFGLAFIGVVAAAMTLVTSDIAQVLLGTGGLEGSIMGFLGWLKGISAGIIILIPLSALVGGERNPRIVKVIALYSPRRRHLGARA